MLRRQCLALLYGHLMYFFVDLIGDEDPRDIGVGLLLDLIQPVFEAREGLLDATIIYEEHALGALVVGFCYGLEPFLSSGVPQLQFHFLIRRLNHLYLKVDTDRRHMVA